MVLLKRMLRLINLGISSASYGALNYALSEIMISNSLGENRISHGWIQAGDDVSVSKETIEKNTLYTRNEVSYNNDSDSYKSILAGSGHIGSIAPKPTKNNHNERTFIEIETPNE